MLNINTLLKRFVLNLNCTLSMKVVNITIAIEVVVRYSLVLGKRVIIFTMNGEVGDTP